MTLKLHDLKSGDILEVDNGFTCLEKGQRCIVEVEGDQQNFYIHCRDGRHYLDGQTGDDAETLIGLKRIFSFEDPFALGNDNAECWQE